MFDFDDRICDMFYDDYEDQQQADEIYKYGNEYFWTTRENEEIKIKDMSDFHLKNTIKYLKQINDCKAHEAWIDVMTFELNRRFDLGEEDE